MKTNWSSEHKKVYEEIDFEEVVDFKPKKNPLLSAFKTILFLNLVWVVLLTIIYNLIK